MGETPESNRQSGSADRAVTDHIEARRAELAAECPWCGDGCTGEVRDRHDRLDAGSEVGHWKRWVAAAGRRDVGWTRLAVTAREVAFADAVARLDDGAPQPGDAELVDRYDERVLQPAWVAFRQHCADQARAATDVGWNAP